MLATYGCKTPGCSAPSCSANAVSSGGCASTCMRKLLCCTSTHMWLSRALQTLSAVMAGRQSGQVDAAELGLWGCGLLLTGLYEKRKTARHAQAQGSQGNITQVRITYTSLLATRTAQSIIDGQQTLQRLPLQALPDSIFPKDLGAENREVHRMRLLLADCTVWATA